MRKSGLNEYIVYKLTTPMGPSGTMGNQRYVYKYSHGQYIVPRDGEREFLQIPRIADAVANGVLRRLTPKPKPKPKDTGPLGRVDAPKKKRARGRPKKQADKKEESPLTDGARVPSLERIDELEPESLPPSKTWKW